MKLIALLVCFFACNLFSAVRAISPTLNLSKTKFRAQEARNFCLEHHLNTTYCILADMSLPSGVKRLVVWDFRKNDTLLTCLVSHGCGKGPWSKDNPIFSNIPDSHCTALGKYKIDERAYSQWGIHVKYLLSGFSTTNTNAMKRQVVFHSWDKIANNEIYPDGTPEGWGCPAISNNSMKIIDALLRKQRRHVLLWIYN